MSALIRRHPLLTYFILAYSIAWGLIYIIQRVVPVDQTPDAGVLNEGIKGTMLLMWVSMLAGPAVAGLLLTRIVDGKEGMRNLFQSMFKWKAGIRWYVAALLIFPAIIAPVLYSLASFSPHYLPGLMLGPGIGAGLIGGFFEEIGWTGFALRRLRMRHTVVYSSVTLGAIHAVWHLFPDYLGSIDFYGEFYFLHFLLWIIALIAFRVIAVWIYDRSKSLLLAQLTHGSFTGSQLVLGPPDVTAAQAVLWYGVFTFLLALAAVTIVVADQKLFFRKARWSGRRKRMALALRRPHG